MFSTYLADYAIFSLQSTLAKQDRTAFLTPQKRIFVVAGFDSTSRQDVFINIEPLVPRKKEPRFASFEQ